MNEHAGPHTDAADDAPPRPRTTPVESAYDAFQEGSRLLATATPHAAAVALERARDLEPDQGLDPRDAGPGLLPVGSRSRRPQPSSRRAVELDPVNDYAHFGLGLCLLRPGDRAGARRHLKLAAAMRPDQRRLPGGAGPRRPA